MENGEFIPVNEDVISNPSTKEGKDEGMSTIDDEFVEPLVKLRGGGGVNQFNTYMDF